MNNYSERAIKWMKILGYLPFNGKNSFFEEQENKYNQYVNDITKSNEMLIFEQLKKQTLENSASPTQQFEEQKRQIVSQYMNFEQYEQKERTYRIIEMDNSRILAQFQFLKKEYNLKIEQLFYTDDYLFKLNQNVLESTTYLDVMKRVSYIYCILHPNIGYISGMNYLLAPIIKVIQKEADCYFCFEIIMEKQQHLFLQSDNQKGLSVTMNRFDELIKNQEPQIFKHLNHLGIALSHIFVRWFLTLFSSDLDIEIVIELWDKMLEKDYQEYQFQIIIEMLRTLKHKILKSNFNQFVELISLKNDNEVQLINSILNK
ncbi:unnamed protein product [Paramecium sonneborni]|uniref:Rab-GAP TBC domain-containing protein n=1 Tax=Paramecium sonneborni TaxID=65129 RepID=A0A8S1RNP1_9CILI|nr:unnamed protein product [Paramecium sonneborni]